MKIDWRPPGGSITWLAAIWFAVGAGAAVVSLGDGIQRPILFSLGSLMAVIGGGLWFRQRWARWMGFVAAAIFTSLRLYSLSHELTLNGGMWLLFSLWCVWILWEWDVREANDGETEVGETEEGETEEKMISLVQLLREPRYLDAQILAGLASRAWGRAVTASVEGQDKNRPMAEGDPCVLGESPNFIVVCDGLFFSILNVAGPYVPDVQSAANSTSNLRIRQPLVEHRAWLSIDVIGGDHDPESLVKAYRYIGKLHAEMIDENCLAIFLPDRSRLYPMEPGMEAKLRADDPLAALEAHLPLPVIQVADDDPRMRAAVDEARRRWPEFIRAFDRRDGNDSFAVKAPISDAEHIEYMWLIVAAIENNIAYGRVDNDPLNVQGVKPGDIRRVSGSEIWDWMYLEGGEMVGGFSVAVLRDIQSSENKE